MLLLMSALTWANVETDSTQATIDSLRREVNELKLKKVAMLLSSGDPDMYDGAMFSYQGDFLDYLQLEDMGVFTTNGYAPGVPEEKLKEIRAFGASLR